MMRLTLVGPLLALLALPSAALAVDWFTVHGHESEPQANIIQISPSTERWNNQLTVNVRVSRSQDREAYGGGQYRSYESLAAVDCDKHEAWYVRNVYYGKPLWKGPVTMTRQFDAGKAPLTFVEIPGEAERLIRAACLLMR